MVGQKQVTEILSTALTQGRIGHAYLFVGPRGCGKTSVARILAHEVNGFKYELEDDYVDIIEIDGASNRGIDDIRELREKVNIAPTSGKYKVYIIDEVHMLTTPAFNALLKTLEEPPRHVIFIMATTDAYKVPPTITSRSQIFTFKLADGQVMFDFLKSVAEKEKIKISDEALKIIAKRAGGSFRDSLSLLEQISTLSDKEITKEMVVSALGLPEDEKIHQLIQVYLEGDVVRITTMMKELLSEGLKAQTIAEEMVNAIIEKPRQELMPLLAKLPEVKEPFSEAKLLVALAYDETTFSDGRPRARSFSQHFTQSSPRSSRQLAQPAVSLGDFTRLGRGNAGKNDSGSVGVLSEKAVSSSAIASPHFDYQDFLKRIEDVSEVVGLQLKRCEYEMKNNVLHLYPRTKIIRNILESKNNRRILANQAGAMKIEIHEAGQHPESVKKDATLAKFSDIMGGEVTNDGGESPF